MRDGFRKVKFDEDAKLVLKNVPKRSDKTSSKNGLQLCDILLRVGSLQTIPAASKRPVSRGIPDSFRQHTVRPLSHRRWPLSALILPEHTRRIAEIPF